MAGIAGRAFAGGNSAGPPYRAWRVRADLLNRVFTNPGHKMATLMPSGASWTAQPSDNATTANFVALYGSRPAGEIIPAIEAELMKQPPSPWDRTRGRKASIPWITPMTLTEKIHSQSAGFTSPIRPPAPTPALLQTTWTLPKARTVPAAAASTE